MKITVVTPTIFRPSLRKVVEEVAKCLLPGDEHIIVRDGETHARDKSMLDSPPMSEYTVYYEAGTQESRYGNFQRDCAIQIAAGDCVVFIDDDDLPNKVAYDILHEENADPNTIHMFSMQNTGSGYVYHSTDGLGFGQVGTPMCVVPNRKDLPNWCDTNGADSDNIFINRVAAMPGMWIKHHPEIICYVPRHSCGK